MAYENIVYEIEDGIATITFNRPKALNALNSALLAEFSIEGAPKCAGLELHRYSIGEMTQRIGKDFELVAHEKYTYINPSGAPRPYIYALYRKIMDSCNSLPA